MLGAVSAKAGARLVGEDPLLAVESLPVQGYDERIGVQEQMGWWDRDGAQQQQKRRNTLHPVEFCLQYFFWGNNHCFMLT